MAFISIISHSRKLYVSVKSAEAVILYLDGVQEGDGTVHPFVQYIVAIFINVPVHNQALFRKYISIFGRLYIVEVDGRKYQIFNSTVFLTVHTIHPVNILEMIVPVCPNQ